MGAWGFVLGFVGGIIFSIGTAVFYTDRVMRGKKYLVKAYHPTLAKPDKVVSWRDLGDYIEVLEDVGYENIRYEEIKEKR